MLQTRSQVGAHADRTTRADNVFGVLQRALNLILSVIGRHRSCLEPVISNTILFRVDPHPISGRITQT